MLHLIALSALLLHAQPPGACDASAVLGFADALLAEGDAYRAIGEYKRFLYLVPEGPSADAARYTIGLSYLRGGQAQAGVDEYTKLAERSVPLRSASLLQVGYAHYLGGQTQSTITELTRWLKHQGPTAPEAQRQRATYLLGWAELAVAQSADAAARFQAVPDFPGKGTLVEQTLAFDKLPSRSPAVAGLLSLVPGLGHLYLGQPLVGLAALGWNTMFGLGLYDSIRTGQFGLSLLLGSLEALWYFGTIFGAVSGAQKFNRDVRQNALDELRVTYDDRPESWPPSPPVLKF